MINMLEDVREFHLAMGHTVGPYSLPLKVRDEKLRIHLISEESTELIRGLAQEDLRKVLDGAMDTLYVVFGTLVAAGFTADEVGAAWRAVHNSNMAKLGPDGKPIIREHDGKIMRPEGWQPPNIEGLIEHMQQSRRFAA